jgi:hypothetical protein
MTGLDHGPCGRCRRQTIGGWTRGGRLLSEQVTVDAGPLDPEQELAHLVAGRRTWTLHTVPDELHPRDARTIRLRPAGTIPRQTVHPDHTCTPPPGGTTP